MNNDHYSRIDSIKIKARADYQCRRCGSDDAVQAHAPNGDHTDWRKGVALCANHHAEEHPEVPRSLFLSKEKRPYWHNISARALGIEFNRHAQTIIRCVKRLGIATNCDLPDIDKERIKSSLLKPKPGPKKGSNKTTIQLRRDTATRLCELREKGESLDDILCRLLES